MAKSIQIRFAKQCDITRRLKPSMCVIFDEQNSLPFPSKVKSTIKSACKLEPNLNNFLSILGQHLP